MYKDVYRLASYLNKSGNTIESGQVTSLYRDLFVKSATSLGYEEQLNIARAIHSLKNSEFAISSSADFGEIVNGIIFAAEGDFEASAWAFIMAFQDSLSYLDEPMEKEGLVDFGKKIVKSSGLTISGLSDLLTHPSAVKLFGKISIINSNFSHPIMPGSRTFKSLDGDVLSSLLKAYPNGPEFVRGKAELVSMVDFFRGVSDQPFSLDELKVVVGQAITRRNAFVNAINTEVQNLRMDPILGASLGGLRQHIRMLYPVTAGHADSIAEMMAAMAIRRKSKDILIILKDAIEILKDTERPPGTEDLSALRLLIADSPLFLGSDIFTGNFGSLDELHPAAKRVSSYIDAVSNGRDTMGRVSVSDYKGEKLESDIGSIIQSINSEVGVSDTSIYSSVASDEWKALGAYLQGEKSLSAWLKKDSVGIAIESMARRASWKNPEAPPSPTGLMSGPRAISTRFMAENIGVLQEQIEGVIRAIREVPGLNIQISESAESSISSMVQTILRRSNMDNQDAILSLEPDSYRIGKRRGSELLSAVSTMSGRAPMDVTLVAKRSWETLVGVHVKNALTAAVLDFFDDPGAKTKFTNMLMKQVEADEAAKLQDVSISVDGGAESPIYGAFKRLYSNIKGMISRDELVDLEEIGLGPIEESMLREMERIEVEVLHTKSDSMSIGTEYSAGTPHGAIGFAEGGYWRVGKMPSESLDTPLSITVDLYKMKLSHGDRILNSNDSVIFDLLSHEFMHIVHFAFARSVPDRVFKYISKSVHFDDINTHSAGIFKNELDEIKVLNFGDADTNRGMNNAMENVNQNVPMEWDGHTNILMQHMDLHNYFMDDAEFYARLAHMKRFFQNRVGKPGWDADHEIAVYDFMMHEDPKRVYSPAYPHDLTVIWTLMRHEAYQVEHLATTLGNIY